MSPAEQAILEAFLAAFIRAYPNLAPAVVAEQIKVWLADWVALQPDNPEQPPP